MTKDSQIWQSSDRTFINFKTLVVINKENYNMHILLNYAN